MTGRFLAFGYPRSTCVRSAAVLPHGGIAPTNDFTPCRDALCFPSACAPRADSGKTPGATATQGSSYTTPLALRFLYSSIAADDISVLIGGQPPVPLVLRVARGPVDLQMVAAARMGQKRKAARGEAALEGDRRSQSSGFAQPGQRVGAFRLWEVPHLGGDEVARELREVREHWAVADHRDPPDQATVVADEPQVGGQAAESLPARKGRRLEHEAVESAHALDEGVNLRR